MNSSDLGFVAPVIGAYLVLVGLLTGSFINLAADRLPRGESVIRPRSHCRACGRQLTLLDLLPVVGYALRRGRCATCQTPIGIAAPLVEALCAALMLAPILAFGVWPGAAFGLMLVALSGLVVTARATRRRRGEPP